MANITDALNAVLVFEGGYTNDPNDTGGETYKGISRKSFPNWAGWKLLDNIIEGLQALPENIDKQLELNQPLRQLVTSFYKEEFWDNLNLDAFNNQDIANKCFNIAVNMGAYIACVFLQKALNVLNHNQVDYQDLPITGHIGNLTIEAVNKQQDTKDILKILNCLQGARYVEICSANPKQERFLRGWLNRVN